VHRIGRTARAGQEGHAVSLVCVDELKLLRDIESVLKCKIEKVVLPGYEVDPRIKAEPVQKGRPQRPGGKGHGARNKSHNAARKKSRNGSPKHHGGGQRKRFSGRQQRAS